MQNEKSYYDTTYENYKATNRNNYSQQCRFLLEFIL
jgi:hypothetical protein